MGGGIGPPGAMPGGGPIGGGPGGVGGGAAAADAPTSCSPPEAVGQGPKKISEKTDADVVQAAADQQALPDATAVATDAGTFRSVS